MNCRACHRDLPIDAFTVDHSKKDGRATICARCDRARGQARRDRQRLSALCLQHKRLQRRVATLEQLVADLGADRRAAADREHTSDVTRYRRLARAIAVAARLEARAQRYAHVLELRAQGLGSKRIAHELGVTRDTARDLIRRAEANSKGRGI